MADDSNPSLDVEKTCFIYLVVVLNAPLQAINALKKGSFVGGNPFQPSITSNHIVIPFDTYDFPDWQNKSTAEEVSFAANGITAEGIKAVDGKLFGDEGVKSLCDILVDNSCIQKLQLSGSSFGDEVGIFKPVGAILENKNILSIYLNSNYGGPLGAAALAKGLEGNKSLRISFFFPSFLRNYQAAKLTEAKTELRSSSTLF
ncbi:hypothetical protein ACS0TY_027384 [Phlomoides rotata]